MGLTRGTWLDGEQGTGPRQCIGFQLPLSSGSEANRTQAASTTLALLLPRNFPMGLQDEFFTLIWNNDLPKLVLLILLKYGALQAT